MVQDGEIYHYHIEHLGTPRELTNQQDVANLIDVFYLTGMISLVLNLQILHSKKDVNGKWHDKKALFIAQN